MAGRDLTQAGLAPVMRTSPAAVRLLAAAIWVLCCLCSGAASAEGVSPLPALCIDQNGITLSGISSGAFMAHQFHVAHSDRVAGAAIVAGGPYQCAGSRFPQTLVRALNVCSAFSPGPFLGPPDPQRSITAVREAAASGSIDAPEGLRSDRVFLFSGRSDRMVPTAIMDQVETVYRAFTDKMAIDYVRDRDVPHAWITTNWGEACQAEGAPFINDCDFDLAGTLLAQMYGPLSPRVEATGRLLVFDQAAFVDAARPHGLAAQAYAYIPAACASGGCRLHVALHGCLQNADTIGDAFVRHAGLNEWAESNRIIVLYPQVAGAGGRMSWPNPQACWDWWGYTGDDFAFRSGAQIAAITAMIDRLADGCH